MLKNKMVWILVAVVSFFPVVSRAAVDSPAGRWWRLPRVAAQLNLSEQEKQQLDSLYLENRKKLIDLKSSLERERLVLEDIMDYEPLNEQQAFEQFRKLNKARSILVEERFRYFLEVRKIIGSDRFKKLKLLAEAFRKRDRFGKE
jgi:hypothetical protein